MSERLPCLPCPPADDRFWAKVDKQPGDGCWLWTGATRSGYGRICRIVDGRQRNFDAHRVAYEDAYGPIDAELHLDHLCRTPACVNPAHLEPVTNKENLLRGFGWSGLHSRKDVCPSGHPYSGDNLYVVPSTGGRACRTCRAAARAGEKARARQRRELGLSPGKPGRPVTN